MSFVSMFSVVCLCPSCRRRTWMLVTAHLRSIGRSGVISAMEFLYPNGVEDCRVMGILDWTLFHHHSSIAHVFDHDRAVPGNVNLNLKSINLHIEAYFCLPCSFRVDTICFRFQCEDSIPRGRLWFLETWDSPHTYLCEFFCPLAGTFCC